MTTPEERLKAIDAQLADLEDGLKELTCEAEADGEITQEERGQLDRMEAKIVEVKLKRAGLVLAIEVADKGGIGGLISAAGKLLAGAPGRSDESPACEAAKTVAAAACDTTKPLTAQEQVWVDEVRKDPEIALLHNLYRQHAPVTEPSVGRVTEFCTDGARDVASTTEGTHYADLSAAPGGHDIILSDKAVSIRESWVDVDGIPLVTSDEEEFKATLIHEMIHHFHDQTEEVPVEQAVTPKRLLHEMMQRPNLYGWYVFQASDGNMLAEHLQNASVSLLHGGRSVRHLDPDTPLAKIKEKGDYENPVDGRNPEEDIATMMSMFLTSAKSRSTLMTKAPRRYDLCSAFMDAVNATAPTGG